MSHSFAEFDEIGYWSEIKLEIVRDYASAYSRILRAKNLPHVYVDAFAGAGQHISKSSGEFIPGSPSNALNVKPPFREYHFIDLNAAKVESLQRIAGTRKDVHIYEGDCNEILIQKIFPTLRYESYRRALCLLDPYGLDLKWEVIFQAGQLGTIDMFLNFPVMDMNRNVLWRNPDKVSVERLTRMNNFWGGDWKDAAYRLLNVAKFKNVPYPMPMRNTKGAIVYYLFFASRADVAEKIVTDIFTRYRNRSAD